MRQCREQSITMSQFCEYSNVAQRQEVFLGVGANLATEGGATPLQTCQRALAMLNLLPGIRVLRVSRYYETDPVPPSSQPRYVNAVAVMLVDPEIDPAALLARLMEVEAGYGRERADANAARTLDLDIVAIGDMVRQAPDPILPHPRMHQRAFVLAPLAEVAPEWRHPILRQTAAELLAALPPQGIRLLG